MSVRGAVISSAGGVVLLKWRLSLIPDNLSIDMWLVVVNFETCARILFDGQPRRCCVTLRKLDKVKRAQTNRH